MSTTIELPGALYQRVAELAAKEGITVEQLVSSALAEKLAAVLTEEYLQERAARASREKFEAALSRVPDVEPEEHDRLG
jgi:predicted transcriptional regulator